MCKGWASDSREKIQDFCDAEPPCRVRLLFQVQSGVKQDMLQPGTVAVTQVFNFCAPWDEELWLLQKHLRPCDIYSYSLKILHFLSPSLQHVSMFISCRPLNHGQCVHCIKFAQGEDCFLIRNEKNELTQILYYSTATWLRQKGHCQNNWFSLCICPVPVPFSCMRLDLIKYSYIYVGYKVRLAVLVAFLLESTSLTWRKVTSNRVSQSLTECRIFPYRKVLCKVVFQFWKEIWASSPICHLVT